MYCDADACSHETPTLLQKHDVAEKLHFLLPFSCFVFAGQLVLCVLLHPKLFRWGGLNTLQVAFLRRCGVVMRAAHDRYFAPNNTAVTYTHSSQQKGRKHRGQKRGIRRRFDAAYVLQTLAGSTSFQNALQRDHLLSEHRNTRVTHRALFIFLLRSRQIDIWSPVCLARAKQVVVLIT